MCAAAPPPNLLLLPVLLVSYSCPLSLSRHAPIAKSVPFITGNLLRAEEPSTRGRGWVRSAVLYSTLSAYPSFEILERVVGAVKSSRCGRSVARPGVSANALYLLAATDRLPLPCVAGGCFRRRDLTCRSTPREYPILPRDALTLRENKLS